MILSGKGKLDAFKRKHAVVRKPVDAWIADVEAADWQTPWDVKKRYSSATVLGKSIIFNIKGNDYRIWVKVSFQNKTMLVKETGTHEDYMKWTIE